MIFSVKNIQAERKDSMKQDVKEYTEQKVKEMMGSFSCCAEAKEAGQRWLDALGTDKEEEETKNLMAELEEDIMPIDTLIAFASSDAGAQVFGAEKTKEVAAHAKGIKEAGGKYCDCPACAAIEAIFEKKDEILS